MDLQEKLNILTIPIGLIIVFLVIRGWVTMWLQNKNQQQHSIPLQVSREEFHKRFLEQIAGNKYYFCGEIEENHKFWFYYYPPGLLFQDGSRYDWYQIQGTVLENEVIYKYFGWYTYRTEEFERERLLNKLKELVS